MGEVGAELVGVADHAAEFVTVEGAALAADALGDVENGAGGVELDEDGEDGQQRREGEQAGGGEEEVEQALGQGRADGEVAAMEGQGWEGTEVLDGGVPGEAVVKVGDGADVDAEAAGVLDEAEDEGGVGGDGEEDLVDEELAGAGEEVVEGAGDVVAAGGRVVGGSNDEAFEAEAMVLEGKQVVAQRVGDTAGTDDEDVAGLDAGTIALVEHVAPGGAAGGKQEEGKEDGEQDLEARNEGAAGEVEGSAEGEAGDDDRVRAHAELVEAAHLLGRAVEAVGAHEENQAESEPEQVRGEEGGRGVEGSACAGEESVREGAEAGGDGAGQEDGEEIEQDGEDAGCRVGAEQVREACGGKGRVCRIADKNGMDGLGSSHSFPPSLSVSGRARPNGRDPAGNRWNGGGWARCITGVWESGVPGPGLRSIVCGLWRGCG
jgi:hypothetical protein